MRHNLKLLKFISALLFFVFGLNLSIVAQVSHCGTIPPSVPEPTPESSFAGCYPSVPGPFFIRIFVHVVRTDNGTGGQTDVSINQAIEVMRADFAPHNIFFVWDECQINVIADSDLYSTAVPSLSSLHTTYGISNGINLFFFPTEQGLSPFGVAMLPGQALYVGGNVIEWDNEIYPAIEHRILSHEMGHCLGLYHTFQQMPDRFPDNDIYCCSPGGERADGSNGCECGDYVEDTPAFYQASSNNVTSPDCHFITTLEDCDGDPYNPDEKNIMNYSYVPCMQYFSTGQGARMRWVISQGGLNPEAWELSGVLVNNVFNALVINTPTTWDLTTVPGGLVTINQSLTINPGASLSISSDITVQFSINASLHVKPDAVLDLNGKLTGLCGSYWQGVYVWGDCSKSQIPVNGVYAQGRFFGKSNGVIEHAVSALRNFGPNGEAGGQIKCTGTTFRNNRLGVVFARYINRIVNINTMSCVPAGGHLDDVSILDRCKFQTNDDYPASLQPFRAFMQLNQVRGVKIWGPDCSNTKTSVDCSGTSASTCYGYGIESISSGFRLNNSLSGSNGTSKFKGLSFGIHATIPSSSRPITINGAEFTDCYKGIYASQTTGIDISSCKFFMGKLPNPTVSDRQFGTIMFQVPLYKYRGNKAYGPPINVEKTVGTCIKDCGDLNNVVFQNRYDNVMIGNVANFLNAGGPEPRGLLYECNTNVGVYGLDFVQPDAGDVVRRLQGHAPNEPSDPFISAGNKFSYNPNVLESDFSYHGGGFLDYRYLPDNPQIVGDEGQEPLDFFGLQATPAFINTNCGTLFDGDQPLLSGNDLQNEKNRYYQNRTAYQQARTHHAAAVQLGNTTLAAQLLERAGHHRFEMDESASDVLYSLMRDTLTSDRDSIRQWMLHLETFGADLAVVLDDLDAGDTTKAMATYNAIPNRFTLSSAQQQDFNQFGNIVSVLASQPIQALDTSAQLTLLSVAQQTSGIAAQTAKSILGLYSFGFESPECTLPECCEFGGGSENRGVVLTPSQLGMKVYPNPARNEVNFELPTVGSSAQIRIFDLSGHLVWAQEIQHKAVWQTEDRPAGLYFYSITIAGEKPQSGKISVIH